MKLRITLILLLFTFLTGFSQTIDITAYDDFLKDHVSKKGVVDFDKILEDIDELKKINVSFSKITPNESWSLSELKSFWINYYNANILKLLAENYPIKSINYIQNAFSIEVVEYSGLKISLDYIEHDIIRKMLDPRVHFALYSTATSSPVLKRTAYQPDTVEVELGVATSNFINDKTKNMIGLKASKLSKVFEWYKDDFEIVDFINKHSGVGKINKETIITYMDYNWDLPREK